MRKAFVHSVPGTGTNFAVKFLEEVLGYRHGRTPDAFRRITTGQVWFRCHTGEQRFTDLTRSVSTQIIVPLRDPYRSYVTRTYKKGWSEGVPERHIGVFTAHWKALIAAHNEEILYLPVDFIGNRTSLLQSVAKRLGAEPHGLAEFVEAWEPVNSLGDTPERTEYMTNGTVHGERLHFLDFAVEWYEARLAELEAVHWQD